VTLIIALICIVVIVAGITGFAFRARLLSLLTSRKGYAVRRDVAFGPLPRQKLDLYVPDGGAADAPLIVFFYGSDWTRGTKAFYRFVAQPFASRGTMVAVPDYRLFPEVTFPQFVEDGALAVAHLIRNLPVADGGTRRVILLGHSAGAHLAAMLATDRRYLRRLGLLEGAISGVVGIAGPYDFTITEEKYRRISPEESRGESLPIGFVTGGEPPMLLITGDADAKVDPGNTLRFAARLRDAGDAVVVKRYPGVGHMGSIVALAEALPIRKPPIRDAILEFIGPP
jgi:acetyl esterase/lipase